MSLDRETLPSNQDRLWRMVESWSIKEPVGLIDAPFLNNFFSSGLFQEKVNQMVEEIGKGKILGEAGFEVWRTEGGFETHELIPIGKVGMKPPLTPHETLEKLKAGWIKFFWLHFHPQHQEIILPSAGFTPGQPPDVLMTWDFQGDLAKMNFDQELYQVVTGHRIAPIMVVGGVNFKSKKPHLLFCQDESTLAHYMLRLKAYDIVLSRVKDQEEGLGFLHSVGYKVALLEWRGRFSDEDLEKLSQFAFTPIEVSQEERFTIDPLSQVESFLAATLRAPKTEEQLFAEEERLRMEEKRDILRKAARDEPLVGLGMVLEEIEDIIRCREEFREITEEEANKLREILDMVTPPRPTLTKEIIRGLIQDIVRDVLWEVMGVNIDFLPPDKRRRVIRIFSEYLDKRPHE